MEEKYRVQFIKLGVSAQQQLTMEQIYNTAGHRVMHIYLHVTGKLDAEGPVFGCKIRLLLDYFRLIASDSLSK